MTNPTGSPSRYQPSARPMTPPKNAPTMPRRIVMMKPPGSRPGMRSLATTPTARPNRIHTRMCMTLLRVFTLAGTRPAGLLDLGPCRVAVGWLVNLMLLALACASCARVQSHYELPNLAADEPSFLPTIEAYTSMAHGGNSVSLLLNGDQIFPAQLEAIRSAHRTISYAQYFYEEGPIGQEIAEALAERCRAGIRGHILLDGFGTLTMPAAYVQTMTEAGCE